MSILASHSIGFIGAGNMAEALIRGLVRGGHVPASQITASGPQADWFLLKHFDCEPGFSLRCKVARPTTGETLPTNKLAWTWATIDAGAIDEISARRSAVRVTLG